MVKAIIQLDKDLQPAEEEKHNSQFSKAVCVIRKLFHQSKNQRGDKYCEQLLNWVDLDQMPGRVKDEELFLMSEHIKIGQVTDKLKASFSRQFQS